VRLLVCGSRNWSDREYLFSILDSVDVASKFQIECVIEGEASGADKMAALWADQYEIPVKAFPAQWRTFNKAAGPIRNTQMLDEGKPDVVVAFHENVWESKGTKDMISQALKRGIPVWLYPGPNHK